jgi:hypothetical protein
VRGVDQHRVVVLRKRLSRGKVLASFATCRAADRPRGLWRSALLARDLAKLGHEVRLMPPQHVRPYVKTNKHDAADDHLIIAIPNCFEAGQIVEQARAPKRSLDIVARAHSDAEVEYLAALGANEVIMGEREIARGMIEYLELERSRGPEGPSSSPSALPVVDADPS